MKTTNPEQRQQVKIQKKLERDLKDSAKYGEQQRAKLEVDVHNSIINSLLSVHHQVSDPIDWLDLALALPPHEPAVYSINSLRKILSDFTTLASGEHLQLELQKMKDADDNEYRTRFTEFQKNANEWFTLKNLASRMLQGDTAAYGEALRLFQPFRELSDLGSEVKFLANDSKKVSCSLLINGLDIIPNEVKTLTTTGKISVKPMRKSIFHDIYQDFACGCCLRIGREIMALLPVEYVLTQIEVTTKDTSSGNPTIIPILSVLLDRKTMSSLNYSQLDPSDSMQNFVARGDVKISKKTGTFSPITPLNFDDFDLSPNEGQCLNSLKQKVSNILARFKASKK
jgi:hypothetical protein